MVEHIDHRHDKEYRPLEKFEFDWHDTTAPYYEDTYHYYAQPLEQYHYISEDDYLQEQKEKKATHSKQEPEPQEPASTDKKSGKKDKQYKSKKATKQYEDEKNAENLYYDHHRHHLIDSDDDEYPVYPYQASIFYDVANNYDVYYDPAYNSPYEQDDGLDQLMTNREKEFFN